jgi:hypothetical protein
MKRTLLDLLDRLEWAAHNPRYATFGGASEAPSFERTLAVLGVMEECGLVPAAVADHLWDGLGIDATADGHLQRV